MYIVIIILWGDFMTCTFFGHRNITHDIEPILYSVLINLIENENVNLFYVGNNGRFDFLVQNKLKELKQIYPHINCFIVLAYIPTQKLSLNSLDTIYPDCLETTPPKFAINKRNKWMIDKSDFVVTYVKHLTGGAAKFKELAEREEKIVINIGDYEKQDSPKAVPT